ncbi:MAG: serpin family protein [Candidatus Obscuribacterales bacterium]|nr:serpin family protein [Candidatus Obscuribacterales bacterium]
MKSFARKHLSLSLLACLLSAGACVLAETPRANADTKKAKVEKGEQTQVASKQTQSSSSFALKFFTETAKNPKENVLVSPYSAYAALSMTLNGAAGKTLEQMAKTLGVGSGGVDALNARNKSVMASLNANDKVKLEIANAIFSEKALPFKQSFIDACKQYYNAEARSMKFGDPATLNEINSWCNTKTHGKIAKILDNLSEQEKMVLLNAIYFKGAWLDKFDPASTLDDKFTDVSGKQVPVRMMHKNNKYYYLKGENFESLIMPYAGSKQSMYIFLPDKNVGLNAFQAKLTDSNWKKWMDAYERRDVNLELPKFKLETSSNLRDVLSKMGMTDAFSDKANFTKMIEQSGNLSRVLQKTYMEVSEEGTEAAAVTAVTFAPRTAMRNPQPPVNFRVDRPFVLALMDNSNDEILFLGSVVKP